MATQRTSSASIPTMPKAAVKIRSRYLLAKDEKGARQLPFCAATSWLVQVLVSNSIDVSPRGWVPLKYPQQSN